MTMSTSKQQDVPVTREYLYDLLYHADEFIIEPMTPPQRGRKQVYQISVSGLKFLAYKQVKAKIFLDWAWYAIE